MSTYTLDLMFLAEDDQPGMAIAQIYLKAYTSRSSPPYKGIPLITAQAMGPHELDGQIDRLKEELEHIRKKGHRKFASQRKRWEAHIEARRSS